MRGCAFGQRVCRETHKVVLKGLGFVALLCVCLIIGCSKPNVESNPAKLLGRTLKLPSDIWNVTHIPSSGMKIVVYYNKIGCTSCRLKQLANWQELINEINQMKRKTDVDVDFIFIFRSSADDPAFSEKVQEYNFRSAVYYDEKGLFEKQNTLPEDMMYHSFLINKNNQILLIGAPIFSPKLWERYKKKIVELSHVYTKNVE